MSSVKQEQDSLVQTLRSADPDAPTLCEGWNVRRLLAHLTQREQRPFARMADMLRRPNRCSSEPRRSQPHSPSAALPWVRAEALRRVSRSVLS